MKIAVLGANGMLGSMVASHLGKKHEVVTTTRQTFNCVHFAPAKLSSMVQDCDYVINAIGAIPQRVQDRNELYSVNSTFPMRLADCGKPVIQIATDCVFSGKCGAYAERSKPDEPSPYGQSKYLGEITAPQFYNLRCSIIGMEPNGNYSLLKWLLSQPKNTAVNGYTNHYWNGITTLQFAKICQAIIENRLKLPNLQHVIPADSVNKYELLKLITRYFNRPDIEIKPYESNPVDRRLATDNKALNCELWKLAGYKDGPPTIDQLVYELAEEVRA